MPNVSPWKSTSLGPKHSSGLVKGRKLVSPNIFFHSEQASRVCLFCAYYESPFYSTPHPPFLRDLCLPFSKPVAGLLVCRFNHPCFLAIFPSLRAGAGSFETTADFPKQSKRSSGNPKVMVCDCQFLEPYPEFCATNSTRGEAYKPRFIHQDISGFHCGYHQQPGLTVSVVGCLFRVCNPSSTCGFVPNFSLGGGGPLPQKSTSKKPPNPFGVQQP